MTDKTPQIEAFKRFYEEDYHEALSDELALEYFEKLLALITVIYRPISNELTNIEKYS